MARRMYVIAFGGGGGIPEKQALAVWVVGIELPRAPGPQLDLPRLSVCRKRVLNLLQHRAVNVLLASGFDGLQAGVALFAAQSPPAPRRSRAVRCPHGRQ